ncbi:hypothetical protein CTAYLR_007415 [Chrysophaeum taylorii]|uniref:PARP-type domain-containing protein n=1 Tax=Chrysophaeum taylorii TaxID=2483200 RepID=A0AAD7U6I6_9STRA|nr:hypothetical protein CTAYLR_007415 [Chrysophaeum taylorii]
MGENQVETYAAAALVEPPNDEQLVAHLTAGNFAMTDQVSVCAQLGFSTTAKDHGHVGGLLAGKIGSNKFVADYAVDSRAKCRDTKCNAYILQSDLRIGKIPPSIKTGHSCRTHWYHLPCIFRSFRRACKGTKTITSVNDIANFDRLRPSDQQHIRICIQCAKNQRDRLMNSMLPQPLFNSSTTNNQNTEPLETAASSSSEEGAPTFEDNNNAAAAAKPLKERKRRASSDKPAPAKKAALMNDMNVSEHEVAGILGLTMLSQPNEEAESPAAAAAEKPPAEDNHPEHRDHPPPAPSFEGGDADHANGGRRLVVPKPKVEDVPTVQREMIPPEWRLGPKVEDVPTVQREMIPPEWRLGPKFSSPEFTDEVKRRWRPPGTKCEFLYRDQWHVGYIESYTSQEAIVKFENREGLVPIDLVTEKHRVCWVIGTYTSQSKFA